MNILKSNHFYLLLLCLIGFNTVLFSQVAINQSGSTANEQSILDISSTSKGLLIPRMSSQQIQNLKALLSSTEKGMIVFDNENNAFYYYDGTNFIEIQAGVPDKLEDTNLDSELSMTMDNGSDVVEINLEGTDYFRFQQGGIEFLNNGSSVFIGEGSGQNDDFTNNYNVFIGYNSGKNNTSGSNNIGSGALSLYNNTTGNYNIAVGYYSLVNNQSGYQNIGLGHNSLYGNISASGNMALGNYSLYALTSGIENTAIGNNSLKTLGNGYYNTVLGKGAGFNMTSGSLNTILGFEAGYGSTSFSGSGNILLGYKAGYYETGSNKLYIENSNSSTPLIGGDFATDEVYINGTIKITGGNPGNNKFLKSDNNGTASWDNIDLNNINNVVSDDSSIYIGYEAGINDEGGTYTVGIGWNALKNNSQGTKNIALGYRAMSQNTLGDDNIAVGSLALTSANNTTANTAIGNYTMIYSTASFNVALGDYALYGNTTGTKNVSVGFMANGNNQTGSNNTMIGYNAGKGTSLHSKSGNVFLGYEAGYNETGSNKLYIENSNSTTPLIGGDFSTDEVYINGTLKITGGDPAAGKVLRSDVAGVAAWDSISMNQIENIITDDTSVFIGYGAGINDPGGTHCVGIGRKALENNYSFRNISIGAFSLNTNAYGADNIAIGTYALKSSTSSANIAIGSYSLEFATNASCISIGHMSQRYNSSGASNIGIGHMANYFNETGSDNTIIGYMAGRGAAIHSKSGNVFLGYKAGYNETGSNKLYIENSDTSTPLIGGDFSADEVYINGTIKITGGSPGSGKILTSDANGNASWQTNTSASQLSELSDADYDGASLFVGDQAGAVDDGNNYNTGLGKDALTSNSSGTFNTALGTRSLFNNTTSANNTAVGYNSLYTNTTAASNTAVGSSALYTNNGSNNTALGSGTLYSNSTGHENTAVGTEAMYSSLSGGDNVSIGYKTLYNNTTGYNNTVIGSQAFSQNTTGYQNVAVGTSAGSFGSNNTRCTYIGEGASNNAAVNRTNSTALGYQALITASNQVRIGNSSVTSIGGYQDWTNVSDKRFKSDVKEDVEGLEFILKLRPVSYVLEVNKINAFLGIDYTKGVGNTEKGLKLRQTGFIAQEVEQVANQLGFRFSGIDKPDNENSFYGLRYAQFVVPLVKAVQELEVKNQRLEKENHELIKRLEKIESILEINISKR